MSFAEVLAGALQRPTDPDALAALADAALQAGEEERALPLLTKAVAAAPTERLWQWKGLLERSLDEHERALSSLDEAARLDPSDASIAHGLARVALEAGVPAEALFERMLRLAPSDGAAMLGLVAARLAAGRAEQARSELQAILIRSPLWIDGHMQLAQLQSMLGHPELATASLEQALQAEPDRSALWHALFDLHVKREDFAGLGEAVERAQRQGVKEAVLRQYAAIAASELGQTDAADRLFAECEQAGDQGLAIWRIRHVLRSGRPKDAAVLIDEQLKGPGAANAWPYAGIAWRLTSDPRWEWLYRDGALVSVIDLTAELPPLDRLARTLRGIHAAKGQYLDQSVRGGTQTDGPLFSRIEPEIRALRAAVVGAVERYTAALPPTEPEHPLLRHRRDRRVRFSGSWSVRLRAEGFHVSHVHPLGWISSALYIAVPGAEEDPNPNAGWLQLGQPRPELNTGLDALKLVKPEPGRLVLFPSWLWHGTLPFAAGERLTVAFDVAPPR